MDAIPLRISHLEYVHGLEKLCYPKDYMTTMQLEKKIRDKNVSGYVVEHHNSDTVIAYTVFEKTDSGIEIIRLGVSPFHLRQKYGSFLINKVKQKLTPTKPTLICNVPDTMLVGHLFLQSQGFVASNVDRLHFRKSMTDSYVFTFKFEWMAVVL